MVASPACLGVTFHNSTMRNAQPSTKADAKIAEKFVLLTNMWWAVAETTERALAPTAATAIPPPTRRDVGACPKDPVHCAPPTAPALDFGMLLGAQRIVQATAPHAMYHPEATSWAVALIHLECPTRVQTTVSPTNMPWDAVEATLEHAHPV